MSEYRYTQQKMEVQNSKMNDQIVLLIEKLEFFIDNIKKEQGKNKRGEYFTIKDEEFKGKANYHLSFLEKDDEIGKILNKMKKIKNLISVMRKQLRLSYDIDRITEIENNK